MLSKPSDLPGPDVGCRLQTRSEGGTWSTVSPVLSWSWLPSPCFPHCQHPFLFLFLSIPQSYFCTGEKWGGMYDISQGHTWPGQKVYRSFLLSHSPDLWQGGNPSQWGSDLWEHTWNLDQGGPETLAHSPVKWCHGALIKILACLFPLRCAPTVSPSSKTL